MKANHRTNLAMVLTTKVKVGRERKPDERNERTSFAESSLLFRLLFKTRRTIGASGPTNLLYDP